MEDTLSELFTSSWAKLFHGAVMPDSGYHTGVASTVIHGIANMRTVVLRAVNPDEKQILFYTDIRSGKMSELKKNNQISWLFYDKEDRVQVRLGGEAFVHHQDEITQYHWDKVREEGRKAYMAIPGPSAGIDHEADGLEYLSKSDIDTQTGYANFAVIVTQTNFIEWLQLKKEGYRRAEFRLIDNKWKGQWLIP